MADFFEVKAENIILSGITHGQRGEHRFIVYLSEKDDRYRIRVNTKFSQISSGIFKCCTFYDRGLCNTVAEFRQLTIDAIEAQAYNSWMDGAR